MCFAWNYEVPSVRMPHCRRIVHEFGGAMVIEARVNAEAIRRKKGDSLGVDFGNQALNRVGWGDRQLRRNGPYLDGAILARGSLRPSIQGNEQLNMYD
jgi:hypothetical protein